ncbi:MAG: GTP-dependent dephospho-CoA kinase family protein [Aigarchaeota archaeon]|nr:GTP-dependent dephospho-CoA kinase family protein [Candidatus Pelearchaeum maunauluense]
MPSKSDRQIFSRPLYFSEELKERLRQPLGTLIAGDLESSSKRAAEEIKRSKPTMVVAVGDVTSSSLVNHGVKPDVIIIDGRYERRVFGGKHELGGYEVRNVKNPAGVIIPEAAEAVMDAVEARRSVAILVDGEEDLLALPAILALSDGGVLAYGQPKKGCVLVWASEKTREKARELLARATPV